MIGRIEVAVLPGHRVAQQADRWLAPGCTLPGAQAAGGANWRRLEARLLQVEGDAEPQVWRQASNNCQPQDGRRTRRAPYRGRHLHSSWPSTLDTWNYARSQSHNNADQATFFVRRRDDKIQLANGRLGAQLEPPSSPSPEMSAELETKRKQENEMRAGYGGGIIVKAARSKWN